MFELNETLDVKVARDIGPQKRSAVIIDNFYKNPDEVRELCLKSDKDSNKNIISGLPGARVFINTPEVRKNLEKLLIELCFDANIWGTLPSPASMFLQVDKLKFLCNVIDDKSLCKHPTGVIPHQDYYAGDCPDNHLNSEFGAVLYLNTPEECAGGTSIWSLNGEMTVPQLDNPFIRPHPEGLTEDDLSPEEVFAYIRNDLDTSDHWKCEHTFEMVYNRFVLYEAFNLHSQCVDLGMFTNYSRINQVFFL